MRVTVSTSHGKVSLEDLGKDCSVDELKCRVLDASSAHCSEHAACADHCLVFQGRRMSDVKKSITKHGVMDGARLVLLRSRPPPAASKNPDEPALPDPAEVERAIRAEAERQGREVAQPSAAPPRPRENPMESRLQEIMQALQNMSGYHDTDMHRHVTQALRQAARMPRAEALAEEVVVAEPSAAHMAQISDMGFSATAARRALLLSRNVVSAAVNYLLAHGGDGDIEAEPTMDELRHVYHARNVRLAEPRQIEANVEHMGLLVSMGFTEDGARHALVRSDNSLEAAINLLTSMPAGWAPPLPAPTAAAGSDTQGHEQADAGEDQIAEAGEHEGEGGEVHNRGAEVSAGAELRAAADAQGVSGSDDSSMLQLSGSESEAVSAEEEEPLLAAEAAEGTNAQFAPMRHSGPAEQVFVGPSGDGGAGVVAAVQSVDAELHTPMMMELQEGMRGLMTALGANTVIATSDGGTAVGGGGGAPMTGAMPILSTGGGNDATGMLDPMRLVDEIRWGGAFPAMLGDLLGAEVEEGDLTFDDYRSDSTVYEDDVGEEADSDEDDEEDTHDEVSDNENSGGHSGDTGGRSEGTSAVMQPEA